MQLSSLLDDNKKEVMLHSAVVIKFTSCLSPTICRRNLDESSSWYSICIITGMCILFAKQKLYSFCTLQIGEVGESDVVIN